MLPPIPFMRWIEENRDQLKPPIGNKVLYRDSEFIIMVVGGPNDRADFHINESEEFFYMIEGDMVLRVEEDGVVRDIPIQEGEIFRLPPRIPHSPQRTANSIGLVIERTRREGEIDGVRWYCEQCHAVLYEEFFTLYDIVEQLRAVLERFHADTERHTCKKCGTRAIIPQARASEA